MAQSTKMTPRRVSAFLAKAKACPLKVDLSKVDSSNDCPNEIVKSMTIGEYLALIEQTRQQDGQFKHHRLQRDTEARLRNKSRTGHLRSATGKVPAAQRLIQLVYWQEALQVLDGNHRTTLWLHGDAICPATVDVIIHYPKSEGDYNKLYECIDSKKSTKNTKDNLGGIFKDLGIPLTSPLFKALQLGTAIQFVSGCDSSPEGLRHGTQAWRDELFVLNSFNFSGNVKKSYSSGVWAGLLLLLRAHPHLKEELSKFADHLRQAREYRGATLPTAIQRFLGDYVNADSHSAVNTAKDVERVKSALYEYLSDIAMASRTRKKPVKAQQRLAA